MYIVSVNHFQHDDEDAFEFKFVTYFEASDFMKIIIENGYRCEIRRDDAEK